MPNPYFQFKQFMVWHDRCAMKVGTDGVLLGAWANVSDARSALDIGTGTGLIALMLAQRNRNLVIDAIDIDTGAIDQAKDNVSQSPFSAQIVCHLKSIQSFAAECSRKYDLIVSNPPYFEQSLKSPDRKRALARHTDSLSVEDLIEAGSTLLTDKGRLSVIYPYSYKEKLMSQDKLFVNRITNVYPTPTSAPKRILIEYSRRKLPVQEDDLVIEKGRHAYTDEFASLVKEFYLKM